MKIFIIFTLLFIGLYTIGFIGKPSKSDFFDHLYSNRIKGFSILTVIWAHGSDHLNIGGIQFIAGVGVALFLICSGYGLEKSFEKNGLHGFWRKRFWKICIPLWIVELIWECIQNTLSWKNYTNNAFLLGGGGWYLQYLLICYLIYYSVKLISKKISNKKWETIVLLVAFGLFFVYECIKPWSEAIPFLRARQMLAFPLGVMLASNKSAIETKLSLKRNQIILASFLVVTGGVFMLLTQLEEVKKMGNCVNNILSLFTVVPLALGILLLTQKCTILVRNWFLQLTGIISYELFLVQNYTQQYINSDVSAYLYVLVTVAIACVLHMVVNFLPTYIKKKINNS
ncbi:MAG: acyltransferase [Lachnospiraceae bacterium]|nr:acyltransferase [Lachnospiraceae bacterium]